MIKKIKLYKAKLQTVQNKIDNLILAIAESNSKNVISILSKLEIEQEQLENEIKKAECELEFHEIDESKFRDAYITARKQFLSGELYEKQILINHFVNKVVVYKEHIEVYINKLPMNIIKLDEGVFTTQWGKKKRKKKTTTKPKMT